ncbi:MAG TPA: transglycosylase SLT domain-containing protein, partial [Thermoanaerobaculia bacterium]|nr:transglycosylase SLT domain-containing protein [Thermoanaerobaculia bacterium]
RVGAMPARRPGIALAIAIAVVVLGFALLWGASRLRPQRRAPLRPAGGAATAVSPSKPIAQLPVDQWSARLIEFQEAQAWEALRAELETLRSRKPAEFERFSLGYLLARVLIELEEYDAAEAALEPYLREGNPFRPLAQRHAIAIEAARGNEAEAARAREAFIVEHPESIWRMEEIETQLDHLAEEDRVGLVRFAQRLRPAAPTALRRELDARSAEARWDLGARGEAIELALRVLRGGTSDDAAERALRLLDDSAVLGGLKPDDVILLGEAARDHRHYDRAVELLQRALDAVPSKAPDLLFAIGRAHFGAEEFDKAEEVYLRGVSRAVAAEQKATFYFHASRAAQLAGEDDRAIRHMTRAIAVPGNFDSTSAALTQRMRTKMKRGDHGGGLADLRQLERLLPKSESRAEASIQAATYLIAAGKTREALAELDRIPASVVGRWERPEINYWKARALEASDPSRALELHLSVMKSHLPTHFAYFSRARLRSAALSAGLAEKLAAARKQADDALAAGSAENAKPAAVEAFLLGAAPEDRERLETVYRAIPAYRAILELEPHPLPRLPDAESPGEKLMAMGLFDEAQPDIEARWGLREMRDALTRAHALNLAAASRDSIYAIEVMVGKVPDDYVPELLPRRVLELLYPRYFEEMIRRDSARYGADPRLVLSIMREESRFNPRAKSLAAARGLLQFIITTARDISQSVGIAELESGDLYDPRVIIQLGAKYVADLLEKFGGNRYRAVAAYNAGPFQAQLWSRIAPGEDDDYFLSSVNFAETKHYVRKVLNSYARYGEIYEGEEPPGGVRAEP